MGSPREGLRRSSSERIDSVRALPFRIRRPAAPTRRPELIGETNGRSGGKIEASVKKKYLIRPPFARSPLLRLFPRFAIDPERSEWENKRAGAGSIRRAPSTWISAFLRVRRATLLGCAENGATPDSGQMRRVDPNGAHTHSTVRRERSNHKGPPTHPPSKSLTISRLKRATRVAAGHACPGLNGCKKLKSK